MKIQAPHILIPFLLTLGLHLPAHADKEPAEVDNLTITTWNIEHLGSNGRGFGGGYGGFGRGSVPARKYPLPRRSAKDLASIAKLVHSELGSDILALQEVGVTALRRGRSICEPLEDIVEELNDEEGDWRTFIPQVAETPPEDSEDNTHLAFLWNQERVRMLQVFEMTIEPSGEISELTLISSELADESLTRKILARIRMIRFDAEQVETTRVNYSFDFLPY